MNAAVLGATVLAAAVGWVATHPGVGQQRLTSVSPDLATDGAVIGARWAPSMGRVIASLATARRQADRERRRRAAVRELCFALAAELSAGRSPADALRLAVSVVDADFATELGGALGAVRVGGDVPTSLRMAADRAGAGGLSRLASCWHVGAGSGAGLALAVQRLAETLRAEEQHRQEVAAGLAGPRSTSRLLAALPVLGLVMAVGMGMQPFGFLLGSPYGALCLIVGVTLDVVGVWWTRRLTRAAERY